MKKTIKILSLLLAGASFAHGMMSEGDENDSGKQVVEQDNQVVEKEESPEEFAFYLAGVGFPEELLIGILQFFNQKERNDCRFVSKKFNTIITKYILPYIFISEQTLKKSKPKDLKSSFTKRKNMLFSDNLQTIEKFFGISNKWEENKQLRKDMEFVKELRKKDDERIKYIEKQNTASSSIKNVYINIIKENCKLHDKFQGIITEQMNTYTNKKDENAFALSKTSFLKKIKLLKQNFVIVGVMSAFDSIYEEPKTKSPQRASLSERIEIFFKNFPNFKLEINCAIKLKNVGTKYCNINNLNNIITELKKLNNEKCKLNIYINEIEFGYSSNFFRQPSAEKIQECLKIIDDNKISYKRLKLKFILGNNRSKYLLNDNVVKDCLPLFNETEFIETQNCIENKKEFISFAKEKLNKLKSIIIDGEEVLKKNN